MLRTILYHTILYTILGSNTILSIIYHTILYTMLLFYTIIGSVLTKATPLLAKAHAKVGVRFFAFFRNGWFEDRRLQFGAQQGNINIRIPIWHI